MENVLSMTSCIKIVPLEVLTLFHRIFVGGRFLLIKEKTLEFYLKTFAKKLANVSCVANPHYFLTYKKLSLPNLFLFCFLEKHTSGNYSEIH